LIDDGIASGHLQDVFALDALHVWIATVRSGGLWSTSTGFFTGSWMTIPGGGEPGVHQVVFVTPDIGYAVAADTVVLQTKDGGVSWCSVLILKQFAYGIRWPSACVPR